jgi:hypothetical protein
MAIKMAEPVDETIVVESELPEGVSKVDTPDILKDRESYVAKLKNDPEVKALTSQIDINDINSVHKFGSKPGERINNLATDILSSVMVPTNKEATEMLNKLAKILKKFDLEELKPEERKNPNFLEKLLKKVRDEFEATLRKYENLNKEVNDVYLLIKSYEQETLKDNELLTKMFHENLRAYEEYEKYIVAAQLAVDELTEYREKYAARTDLPESVQQPTLMNIDLFIRTMSRRADDLLGGATVGQLTVPTLLQMQQANVDLISQYNQAFTIGIPAFKMNLSKAILQKRTSIRANSMQEFNDTIREQTLKAAEQGAKTAVQVATQANETLFSFDDLSKFYSIVSNGTKNVNEALEKQDKKRAEDRVKIEALLTKVKKENGGE